MHAVNHQRCLNIIDTLFDVFRKGSIKKWNINGLVTCHECAVLIVQPFGLWLMVETAQECILPSLFSLSLSVHMSMFICIVVFLPFPFAPLSSCCRYSRISLGHPFLSTNLISSKSWRLAKKLVLSSCAQCMLRFKVQKPICGENSNKLRFWECW